MATCTLSNGAQGSVKSSTRRLYACDYPTERSPYGYKDVLTTLEDGTVKRVHDEPDSLVFSDSGSFVTAGAQVVESDGVLSNVKCGEGHVYPEARPYFNGDYPVDLCCGEGGCEEM